MIKDILIYNLLPGGVFLIASLPQGSSSLVGSLISLLCALFFFWLALSKIFLIIQRTTRRLHLFQGGLIIEKRHQVQVCPWHQVTEIWQNLTNWRGKVGPRRYSYLYTLRLVDGSQIKLNDLTEGIAELGRTVSQNITQELLPQALKALQRGESLSFGPFRVDMQGIRKGRRWLPWSHVHAVRLNGGTSEEVIVEQMEQSLILKRHLIWETVAAAKIPNVLVLTGIAEEMIPPVGKGS
ncbi:MAG TPA: DUF6585 family protein [Ktedonobacteraceae bacterium]|nr:DUF6585 family protein [Ktedonobacteraceae bacterium]